MVDLPGDLAGAIARAHKALNLCEGLTATDRRFAAAVLEHFNRTTGQCDPGASRLASLLGVRRQSIIESARRVHEAKLIERVSYGGKAHRNRYVPNWSRFDEIIAEWRRRFSEESANADSQQPAEAESAQGQESANADSGGMEESAGADSQQSAFPDSGEVKSPVSPIPRVRSSGQEPNKRTYAAAAGQQSANADSTPGELGDEHLLDALLRALGRTRSSMPPGMGDLAPVRQVLAEGRSLVDLLAHLAEVPPRRRLKAVTWQYFVPGWREAPRRVAAGRTPESAPRADEIAIRLGLAGEHLRRRLGDAVITSWFGQVTVEEVNDMSMTLAVPTRFLRDEIAARFHDDVLAACRVERPAIDRVNVVIGHRPTGAAA